MNNRRVMMVQQGARRNYIYAQLLEAEGLLNCLICDLAWPDDKVPWLARKFVQFFPNYNKSLLRRSVKGVAPKRVHSSFLSNIVGIVKKILPEEQAYSVIDEALAISCRLVGVSGVDVIVNYQGNGGSYLKHAKNRGAHIVTDFIITPLNRDTEIEEQKKWPAWETKSISVEESLFYKRRVSQILAISDIYMCPSQTVARDLATLEGFDSKKVRIVPYGLSGVLKKEPQPQMGRVLFAGAAGLRKGIPYLAEAARILKERNTGIEIFVAGAASSTIRSRPEVCNLVFLDKLGREQMADEFARADIFCLPSLAEGSATVIFEAMAFGLPIVTTASSGSVVEDGMEGYIVPECDGKAIADAIERIVTDRDLRDNMSKAALDSADKYSDENCGAKFIKVIKELLREIDGKEKV